ncbi:MAG: Ldh family oxidoreductase [Isosphaeraceae bacterium]
MRTIDATALTGFGTELLIAAGVPRDEAAVVSASLVGANLRGHDSHGVMRIPQYVDYVERGNYRTGVDLEIVQETPALVVCDGHWGLGQVQAHRLLDLVIPKARALGVAVGTARDCGHIGRLGEYAERAAGLGLLLLATVNNGGAVQRVAPPGGIEPRLSTNPFCAGVPTTDPDAPIVVDFGTSIVAEGKVRGYYISKQRVPEGWLLDHQGAPTTDPAVLYEPPLGTILPLGGTQSYKGFGLGLILDLWAGGLSGGPCSQASDRRVPGNNVFFLVMDQAGFVADDHLSRQASELAESIRATPRVPGVDAVLLPGDPERLTFEVRNVRGIPLDEQHWARLIELAGRLHVKIPD